MKIYSNVPFRIVIILALLNLALSTNLKIFDKKSLLKYKNNSFYVYYNLVKYEEDRVDWDFKKVTKMNNKGKEEEIKVIEEKELNEKDEREVEEENKNEKKQKTKKQLEKEEKKRENEIIKMEEDNKIRLENEKVIDLIKEILTYDEIKKNFFLTYTSISSISFIKQKKDQYLSKITVKNSRKQENNFELEITKATKDIISKELVLISAIFSSQSFRNSIYYPLTINIGKNMFKAFINDKKIKEDKSGLNFYYDSKNVPKEFDKFALKIEEGEKEQSVENFHIPFGDSKKYLPKILLNGDIIISLQTTSYNVDLTFKPSPNVDKDSIDSLFNKHENVNKEIKKDLQQEMPVQSQTSDKNLLKRQEEKSIIIPESEPTKKNEDTVDKDKVVQIEIPKPTKKEELLLVNNPHKILEQENNGHKGSSGNKPLNVRPQEVSGLNPLKETIHEDKAKKASGKTTNQLEILEDQVQQKIKHVEKLIGKLNQEIEEALGINNKKPFSSLIIIKENEKINDETKKIEKLIKLSKTIQEIFQLKLFLTKNEKIFEAKKNDIIKQFNKVFIYDKTKPIEEEKEKLIQTEKENLKQNIINLK